MWIFASGILCLMVYVTDVVLEFVHTSGRDATHPLHYKL